MPHHPKNRLKLTGDTHLPDVGDLLAGADEVELTVVEIDAPPRVYADGWVPDPHARRPEAAPEVLLLAEVPQPARTLPAPLASVERKVERRVASTPWLAVGAALGFGFLVAKMLRR